MANGSPSSLIKQVDTQVSMILRKVDQAQAGSKARAAIAKLGQALVDSKIYSTDYELSEMRDEQLENAKTARKYLNQARAAILKASEFNVFGAVDVAHLTAKIDQAKAELK
jgi:hypothetical protein